MHANNHYGIVAFFLFFFILLLSYLNYDIWSNPSPLVSVKEKPRKLGLKPRIESPVPVTPRESPGMEAIQVIAERNIFTPDRKEFSLQKGTAEQAKPVVRSPIVLYGIVIAQDNEMAVVANPGRPMRKGERETMTVKLGDRIGDYKLAKVLPDRIVLLEASGDSFEVLLHDPKTPKQRAEIRTTGIQTTRPSTPAPATSAAIPLPATSTAIPQVSPSPAPARPLPRRVSPGSDTPPPPDDSAQEVMPSTPMSGPQPSAPMPAPGSYPGRRNLGPGFGAPGANPGNQ